MGVRGKEGGEVRNGGRWASDSVSSGDIIALWPPSSGLHISLPMVSYGGEGGGKIRGKAEATAEAPGQHQPVKNERAQKKKKRGVERTARRFSLRVGRAPLKGARECQLLFPGRGFDFFLYSRPAHANSTVDYSYRGQTVQNQRIPFSVSIIVNSSS